MKPKIILLISFMLLISAIGGAPLYAAVPGTGDITGKVTDFMTKQPIAGVHVYYDANKVAHTDVNGVYVLTDAPLGNYPIFAGRADYYAKSKLVTVTDGATTTVNFVLRSSTIGAIKGMVKDADTGMPISGAEVTDGVNTAATNTSGSYLLSGVAVGDSITVTASVLGYDSVSKVTPVRGGIYSLVDFALSATP